MYYVQSSRAHEQSRDEGCIATLVFISGFEFRRTPDFYVPLLDPDSLANPLFSFFLVFGRCGCFVR